MTLVDPMAKADNVRSHELSSIGSCVYCKHITESAANVPDALPRRLLRPQMPTDKGYAAKREDAMADFNIRLKRRRRIKITRTAVVAGSHL